MLLQHERAAEHCVGGGAGTVTRCQATCEVWNRLNKHKRQSCSAGMADISRPRVLQLDIDVGLGKKKKMLPPLQRQHIFTV